jgi:hypothetical protein
MRPEDLLSSFSPEAADSKTSGLLVRLVQRQCLGSHILLITTILNSVCTYNSAYRVVDCGCGNILRQMTSSAAITRGRAVSDT